MEHNRFVSLHGFFAFSHAQHWQNETDEVGHYIFSKPVAGQGVVRIMLLQNEFSGEQAAKQMLDEVFTQNKDFNPELLATALNRFIFFVKEHEVNNASYTVYYWATANNKSVVLFTYTLQTSMKDLVVCQQEKQEVESMIASFEFLTEEEHKH